MVAGGAARPSVESAAGAAAGDGRAGEAGWPAVTRPASLGSSRPSTRRVARRRRPAVIHPDAPAQDQVRRIQSQGARPRSRHDAVRRRAGAAGAADAAGRR